MRKTRPRRKMQNPFDIQRDYLLQIYEARILTLWNLLPTVGLYSFIVGVSLSNLAEHYRRGASRYLLLAAVSAAFTNALMSYLRLRRSRKAYNER
jgi:hypothetical protein